MGFWLLSVSVCGQGRDSAGRGAKILGDLTKTPMVEVRQRPPPTIQLSDTTCERLL